MALSLLVLLVLPRIVLSKRYDTDFFNVTVFNAFSNEEVLAKPRVGSRTFNQIAYGNYTKKILNSKAKDYIIQFIRYPRGGKVNLMQVATYLFINITDVLHEFMTYGHLAGYESDIGINNEILIIIMSKNNAPFTRSTIFPEYNDGLSRIYFFNAMQNTEQQNKGI